MYARGEQSHWLKWTPIFAKRNELLKSWLSPERNRTQRVLAKSTAKGAVVDGGVEGVTSERTSSRSHLISMPIGEIELRESEWSTRLPGSARLIKYRGATERQWDAPAANDRKRGINGPSPESIVVSSTEHLWEGDKDEWLPTGDEYETSGNEKRKWYSAEQRRGIWED